MERDDHTRVLLSGCLGKRVSAVRRLFYDFRGEMDRTEGDLILTFEDVRSCISQVAATATGCG